MVKLTTSRELFDTVSRPQESTEPPEKTGHPSESARSRLAATTLGTALAILGAMLVPIFAALKMRQLVQGMGQELSIVTGVALTPVPALAIGFLAIAVLAKDVWVRDERIARRLNVGAAVLSFVLITGWVLALFLPILPALLRGA